MNAHAKSLYLLLYRAATSRIMGAPKFYRLNYLSYGQDLYLTVNHYSNGATKSIMGEFDGIEPRITWEISFAEDGETTNLQRVNVNDYRLTDPQKALVFCAIIRYLAQFGYVKDDSAISRIPNQNFGPEPTLAMHIRHVQSVKEHMEKVDGKIAASHRNAIVARRESVGYARVSEGYDRFVSARRA